MASVYRKGAGYLVQTIQNLLDNSDTNNRNNTYLVVFLADFDFKDKSKMSKKIGNLFDKHVNDGFLHVIKADGVDFYPDLENLKQKYGDSKLRTKWRSKQNVDYAFLMCYCKTISDYYLHLEDDVAASPKFIYKLQDFISHQSESWSVIDASTQGHVGKMYHSRDLGNVASYLRLMYDEMPVDWLIPRWVDIHGGYKISPANLFMHLGVVSSLSEKAMNVTDRYFDQYDHKYSGLNPVANVTSSLTSYEGKPHDAYNRGFGHFWSRDVEKGDFVLIRFRTATKVKQIFVDTGSNIARDDFVRSANLEVSFVNKSAYKDRENACVKFEAIGTFRKGMVNVSLTDEREIICVRLLVKETQDKWFFLREINIWPQ